VNRSRPIISSPCDVGILDLAVGKWVYTRPCDEHVAQGSDRRSPVGSAPRLPERRPMRDAAVEFHDCACVGQWLNLR